MKPFRLIHAAQCRIKYCGSAINHDSGNKPESDCNSQILNEEFAVDLGRCLNWGEADTPC